MAVDTRDKRSSAIYLTEPWRNQLPTPSGTIGAGARQQVALLYSGIAAAPLTPPPPIEPPRPMIVHCGRLMGWP